MSVKIPSPRGLPFVGNINDLDQDVPIRSMLQLVEEHGPIFELVIFGREIVFLANYELINEVSDENRFHKHIVGPLKQIRGVTKDALFTAETGETNWKIAHEILVPAFSRLSIPNMFFDMLDICSQLVLKWERFGPDNVITPSEDFTRLAFDTAALCTMSYRFNSFYREDLHPFLIAMSRFLKESFARANRGPPILQALHYDATKQFEADAKEMMDTCEKLVRQRKQYPIEKKDLLNLMLTGKTRNGEGLSEENIKAQIVTFLIAGHETTSGLLSFVVYYLLKNPIAYKKVQQEVDEILGTDPIRPEHLLKLPYTRAALDETLRLSPSAPQYTISPKEDTVIGDGKYAIKKNTTVVVLLPPLHRDPAIWGNDAEDFKPERMLTHPTQQNAYKPFGNGERQCIGRYFALTEALITLATLVQKFELRLEDPNYTLQLKQMLTIKPDNFKIRAIPRKGAPAYITPCNSISDNSKPNPPIRQPTRRPTRRNTVPPVIIGPTVAVCYASNTGTSQELAEQVVLDSESKGFRSRLVKLNEAANQLSKDEPVVIITASYDGKPANDATEFVKWLESLKGNEAEGIKFAVFGCGDRDYYPRTYQAIPKLCQKRLSEHKGEELIERGEGDALLIQEAFNDWEEKLWKKLGKVYGIAQKLIDQQDIQIKIGKPRAAILMEGASEATIVTNELLTSDGAPPKRHIELELPEGMRYQAGDHLAIIPTNPPDMVARLLRRLGMSPEIYVTITTHRHKLPVDTLVSIEEVLSGYVELSHVAQPKNLEDLRKWAPPTGPTQDGLVALSNNYEEQVLKKRLSVFDILNQYLDINIPVDQLIRMLPNMQTRQYSISSSPLENPRYASLTISVLDGDAYSGRGRFLGAASNYLSWLEFGDKVYVTVTPASAPFRLPADVTVPIIMYCAGAGIAPMRGFIEERAAQKASGHEVGKVLLFFGCKGEDKDYLYHDDLLKWTELGILDVRPAFSEQPEKSFGCRYVQHRIDRDRADIIAAYRAGAKVYVCCSVVIAQEIHKTVRDIIARARGISESEAEKLMSEYSGTRYAREVFG